MNRQRFIEYAIYTVFGLVSISICFFLYSVNQHFDPYTRLAEDGYNRTCDEEIYKGYIINKTMVASYNDLNETDLHTYKLIMDNIQDLAEDFAKENKLKINNKDKEVEDIFIHKDSEQLERAVYGRHKPTKSVLFGTYCGSGGLYRIDLHDKSSIKSLIHEYGHHFFGADHKIVIPFTDYAYQRWLVIWAADQG